jgi:hypothetical protein
MQLPPVATADEANSAVSEIIWNVYQFAPPGWQRAELVYREVGAYSEGEALVTLLDGTQVRWPLPEPLTVPLESLRLRMRTPGNGTWHTLALDITFPAQAEVAVDWDGEPEFQGQCPLGEYQRELTLFHEDADLAPGWLLREATRPANPLDRFAWFPTEGDPASAESAQGPETLVKESETVPAEILELLVPILPERWATATYEARVVGSAQEHVLTGKGGDGEPFAGRPSVDLMKTVWERRQADYTPETGAWFQLTIELEADGPSKVVQDYGNRPSWLVPVPASAYAEELRGFPRADAAIPEWLDRRARQSAGTTQAAEAEDSALHLADVFDGSSADTGRPTVNRPGIPEEVAQAALEHLKRGTLVLTARQSTGDLLFPDAGDEVPMAFSTDGTWVWPHAVVYYLERYRMPPDPRLLDHIRSAAPNAGPVTPDVLAAVRQRLTRWIETGGSL